MESAFHIDGFMLQTFIELKEFIPEGHPVNFKLSVYENTLEFTAHMPDGATLQRLETLFWNTEEVRQNV